MKLSFESVFNDSGGEQDAPLKRLFLAQRKWIIACATFVFLVSNGFWSIDKQWLAFSFYIDHNATELFRAVCSAGLLFTAHMISNAYAFLKTHKLEQRKQFDALDIAERDTFASRIEELQKQKNTVAEELSEREKQFDGLQQNIQVWENRIRDVKDYATTTYKFGATEAPESLKDYLARTHKSKNAFAPINTYSREEIEDALSAAQNSLARARASSRIIQKSADTLLTNIAGIEDEIASAEASRAALSNANEREWSMFYSGRILSDCVSLTPSAISAVYCGVFLVVSFNR